MNPKVQAEKLAGLAYKRYVLQSGKAIAFEDCILSTIPLVELLECAKALKTYARQFGDISGESGECWNWFDAIHDDDLCAGFDWYGDTQDEPWEIAEKALAALDAKLVGKV
jgi:hypothetical protein